MVTQSKRRSLAGGIACAIALTLSVTACGSTPEQTAPSPEPEAQEQMGGFEMPEAPTDVSGGTPWIDSNLKDNILPGMETSPKDDLYLYVNYDWLLENDIAPGDKVAGDGMDAGGRAHAFEAISGKDLTGHDARQAQLFYRAAKDMTARDEAGVEPARATVDAIRNLSTIDEVTAFLLDSELSAGTPQLVEVRNKRDPEDKGRYAARVDLSMATFGSSMGTIGLDATMVAPTDELWQARLASASSVLTRLGMSEDEVSSAFENRVELERKIIGDAEGMGEGDEATSGDGTRRLTPQELDGYCDPFPMSELAQAQGYGEAHEFLINDEDMVRAACALYTQDNIDSIRDYLLVGYALEAASWLDGQAFDAWRQDYIALGYYDQLASPKSTAEEDAFNMAAYVLPTPVGRAYTEAFDMAHIKEFVEGLCHDAIESHKEVVSSSTWLSDASKENLCEKLDGITSNAVYPDVWEDYAGLDLDGLSYYDVRRAIWLFDIERNAALTNQAVDERIWRDPTLILSTAHYEGDTNSFRVAAGSVEADVSRYEAGQISMAALMGGPVGYCIFHEIGHALDTIDLGIDKFGQPIEGSLLDAGDVDEYERRVQKAKDYYDNIVAYKGQNVVGEVCLNEGLNEISAMQARLAYAAHQEGFDYKEFFEVHARRVRGLRTPELEQQCILGADTHPSAYLDINGSTQQFDEFYETYGAKEGDGMYLAPEARVALW